MNRAFLLCLALFFLSGCDIPYKGDYEKVKERLEKAEQKAAKAEAELKQLRKDLKDEQEAFSRIFEKN
jgi:septal ring factor EnvC (AmiA/AmiB activator)